MEKKYIFTMQFFLNTKKQFIPRYDKCPAIRKREKYTIQYIKLKSKYNLFCWLSPQRSNKCGICINLFSITLLDKVKYGPTITIFLDGQFFTLPNRQTFVVAGFIQE